MTNTNIILDNRQREIYSSVIEELKTLCPETISRKIPEANIQQAFVYDAVQKLCTKHADVLSVGCFEDTAYEALLKIGYSVVGIDPCINTSLEDFSNKVFKQYNVIFSTSVIEHVENDELFIRNMCSLLKPGGYGILTCDFKNDYKPGDPKPSCDHRLYTMVDLLGRFSDVIKNYGCEVFGEVNYEGENDFVFEGISYCFATYVFRKN